MFDKLVFIIIFIIRSSQRSLNGCHSETSGGQLFFQVAVWETGPVMSSCTNKY